jgi:hypothetical protein
VPGECRGIALVGGTIHGMADHGSDTRYRDGCRCRGCRAAHAEVARNQRARNPVARTRRSNPLGKVLALPKTQAPADPDPVPVEPGPVEQSVIDQCQDSALAEARPATVQQALALARVIDNKEFAAMHPTASRQLHTLLTSLEPAKKKARGKLYAIQNMQARR